MQQAGYYHHPPAPPGAPNPYMQGYYYMQTPPPYELAGFGARFAAFFVDSIIISVISSPISFLLTIWFMDSTTPSPEPDMWTLASLFIILTLDALVNFAVLITYFTIMEGGSGNATLGKRLLKIRVADEYGRPIGTREAFIRNFGRFTFIPIFSGLILIIDSVLILTSDREQRIGDRIAHTIVVKERQPFSGPLYYPPPAQAYGPYAHPPYQPPPQEDPYRME